jgi:hypothetical protein
VCSPSAGAYTGARPDAVEKLATWKRIVAVDVLMIRQLFTRKLRRLPDDRVRSEFERVVRLWRGEGRWGVL